VLVVFGAWCRACNFISVHCALCAMFCVQCKAYAQTTSCTGKSLHVQFTRRNALHCAGCSVFLGPVYFVHQLCSVFESVCNATCARCALCKCRAIRCVQNLSVPRLLCTQASSAHPDSVQCACSKQGVHCSICSVCIVQMSCAFCCVQGVSVPRLPCAQAVYSAPPSLCNVCVPCRVCNARCAQCEQSPSQVQIAAQRLRPLPPAFILCSVCAVNIVCTIPTSDGARRGSQVPPFSSKVCGNRVNSVPLA